jgi:SulP family sulfate permease
VGFDILDYRFLKLVKKAPRHDTVVMVTVFLLTLFVDLIIAVGAGITMASLLITYRIAKQSNVNIVNEEQNDNRYIECANENQVKVIQIQGAFFFGSVSQIIDGIDHRIMGTKYVVIDVQKVQFFDLSALFALEDMIDKVKTRNMDIMLVTNRDKISCFKDMNLYGAIGEQNIFFDLQKAISYANENVIRTPE